nr:SMP-30/gluconolactonase/LRE family protein [Pontibacillus sp. HN14]
MHVELIVDSKSLLGEGPSWDREKKVLYWVDILGEQIHFYQPNTTENKTIDVGQVPGAIAPRENGGAVLALENGFYAYNGAGETFEFICNPEEHLPHNRFNDGKCDPAGRFWAGTMDKEEEKRSGTLYCLDENRSVKEKVTGVGISNGIAWSPDHTYMYYIDTFDNQVVRYQYEMATGEIQNPDSVLSFEQEEGAPDGMTIDEEGMLWIAHFGGAKVSRWNPATGEKVDEIQVPALNVTCCVFGGENMNELFITTARKDMSEEDLQKYPHAGGLFKVKTNVRGCESYKFSG